jgi:hypothetical protein
MFKEMSLSRFTGWAVVTAFCGGIVLANDVVSAA